MKKKISEACAVALWLLACAALTIIPTSFVVTYYVVLAIVAVVLFAGLALDF